MKHEIAGKLMATVRSVEPKLRGMSDAEAAIPLKEGGWSRKELLGHLIDSASNNHQRFVRLQQFEHIQLAGYAQEHWVRSQGYAEADWSNLIDLWTSYNLHLADVIRRIKPECLNNRCELTPGRSATLDYFVDDYLGHLQHHLRQMGVSNETTVPYPLPGSPEG
jgi:DinB superfamily